MRAIIIAAGMGQRLRPHTDERPKCLVEVAGKSILQRQLEAYRSCGVDEICIVRGYQKERIQVPGARLFDNDDFRANNILLSLMYAEAALDEGVLISYSDIVFGARAVQSALDTPGDFALVIDRRFRDAYVGRAQHPLSEAEVARVDAGGRVTRVGKRTVPADEAAGEFIGLLRLSQDGAAQLRARFHQRRASHAGKPYGTAARFEVAYLTDLFNDLIDDGTAMQAAWIDGGWREIDTVEDLERVSKIADTL